jgi:hypothetical protein
MGKIKVVPRTGSRRIGTNVVKRYYESIAHADREESYDEEPYQDERWQGTTQKQLPDFYHKLRRFPFKDPTDPKFERELTDYYDPNQKAGFDEINRLAKSLRWRDPKGKMIEHIDIFDPDDNILNHEDMFVKFDAGTGEFDDADPKIMLMFLHLRATDEYEVGPEKNQPIMNRKVKYVIVDDSLAERIDKEKRLKKREVFLALDALQKPSDKLKVALMLNLVDKHTVNNITTLDNLLDAYANDDKTYVSGVMTRQEHFLKVLKEPKELHDAYFLFSLGIEKGFIKFNNNHWMVFGNVLSTTRDGAVESLSQEANKDIYSRLAEACKLALEMQIRDKDYNEELKGSMKAHQDIIQEDYISKIDTGKSIGRKS